MNLHDKCQAALEKLAREHLKRQLPPTLPDALDLSSNDYLGLSKHPAVIKAGVDMVSQYGAGSTGSRLLSGNLPCFEALETQIADFKRHESALLFSTGYQANAGVLSTLLSETLWGEAPLVFTDKLIHASLHHACQLAGLRQIRFRHNDLDHLEELLHKHNAHQRPHVIVVETVYGMDGDTVDLERLAAIALTSNGLLYIDEAHATGVIGPEGRGLGASTSDAMRDIKKSGQLLVMGTFSKAAGVSGAYVACSETIKSFLINHCKAFVYSTAPSPFTVGAIAEALRLIPTMDTERKKLHANAEELRLGLGNFGLSTGQSTTQIIPIILGEASQAISARMSLLDMGFITSAIRPPTVPPKTARLRLALNSQVTADQIGSLLSAIQTAINFADKKNLANYKNH